MHMPQQLTTLMLWIITGISTHRSLAQANDVLPRIYPRETNIASLGTWQPTRKSQNAYDTVDTNFHFIGSNRGCFPNILQKPANTNLLKKLGKHYAYRYLPEPATNPKQICNAELTYSSVPNGAVFLPDSSIEAVHCVRNYNAVTLTEAEYPQCISEHSDILSTPAGVDYHLTFSNDDAAPEYKVWYHLYDDPSPIGLEILFTCTEPNYATGSCYKPALIVSTAIHPGRMSYRTKREIDELISQILFPFCMSYHHLLPVLFRPEYPTCDTPPNPAFAQLVRGMMRSLHRREPTDRLTRRPSTLPSLFQPRVPYPSFNRSAHSDAIWRVNGSSRDLNKVRTVYYRTEDRQASASKNRSSNTEYKVVYQAPVYSEVYSSDNKTFLGFGKIPAPPFRPSNNQGDDRPHNETLPVPHDHLSSALPENRTPGRNTLASTYRLPANLRYDGNETLLGVEEVPGSSGSSHPTTNQVDRYGNPSEITGPDRVSSRVSPFENSEDYSENNSLYQSRTRVSDSYDPNEYPEHEPRAIGTLLRNVTMSRPYNPPESPDDRSGNSSLLTDNKVSRPAVYSDDPADYPEGGSLVHSSLRIMDSYNPSEYPELNRRVNETLYHSRKVPAAGLSHTAEDSGKRHRNNSAPIALGVSSAANLPRYAEGYPEDNDLFQTGTRVSDSYDPNDYPEHTPRGNETLRGFEPYSQPRNTGARYDNSSVHANSYNASRPGISHENSKEYPEGRTLRHNSTVGTADSYNPNDYPESDRRGNGTLRRPESPDQIPSHGPRTAAKDPYGNNSAFIGAIGVSSSLYQLVRSEDYPEGNNLLHSTSRISDPYDPDEYSERVHRSNETLLQGPYSSAGHTTDRHESSTGSSDSRKGMIQNHTATDNQKINGAEDSPLPDSRPEIRADRQSHKTVQIPEHSRSLAISESTDPHVSKGRDAGDYHEAGDNDLAGSKE